MTSGKYLRELRERKGLSLRQVSIKSGVSHTQIADIEKGVNFGSKEKLDKILKGLGITSKEIEKFYEIQNYEKTPEPVLNEMKKLKEEILELKKKVQECAVPVVHNNQNNIGQQIIGHHVSNIKMDSGESEDLDISDLSPERVEELKRFIKFLKNS